MNSENLRPATFSLLAKAGLQGDFSIHPLQGGGNNKVFRVDLKDSCVLLKAYFQHPEDPRDRLQAEFSFSSFAWKNGIRCLPQPIACDSQNRLGLYEFVQGRQLLPHEVTETMIWQAFNFYGELNRCKQLPGAAALPKASEACFAIATHLQCVERRLRRLRGVDDSSGIDREAAHFIRNELSRVWSRVAESVFDQACKLSLPIDNEIAQQDRCLSPSDFGFHNAILSDEGQLRFIDFEYAGWDDPAKMVCDFFCQPAVPVPLDYYDMFIESVISDLSQPEVHLQRIVLLLPVYQIKWCCILLNDFLPTGSERRRFASHVVDQEAQKVKQLEKARHALQTLTRF